MRLKLFPDKEIYYYTETDMYYCGSQECSKCPVTNYQGTCASTTRYLAFKRLEENIQELIKLLCTSQRKGN